VAASYGECYATFRNIAYRVFVVKVNMKEQHPFHSSIVKTTNVIHFLFNLLRIKGLYIFRALLAHPQEELHSGTWYIACVLCQLAAPGLKWKWRETLVPLQS
jgi:hypothetical protein